jgi:putative Mg2+ transporter-C (MgtC) family protein
MLIDWTPQLVIFANVALAILLGGLIGIEREIADKPAGFRTHMLVAGAAALLVGLANPLLDMVQARESTEFLRPDPIRIVEAIVAGISFLGAGTIIRGRGEHVEGLTTAASILVCSAIGIAVAVSQYALAVGVTLLVLLVLRGAKPIERWLQRRRDA